MNGEAIGSAVRRRREALGLSQQRLATLASVPRGTIEALERGELSSSEADRIVDLLQFVGLDPRDGGSSSHGGLQAACRASSASYRLSIDEDSLARALSTGDMPSEWIPHLATLIDEVPLPLLVAAVEETSRRKGTPPQQIWQNLLRWASEIRSPREAWH